MTAEQRAGLSDAALAMTQPCIDELIRDVSRRIKKAGAITDTAEYQIYRAQALGESKSAIEKAVAKQLDINEEVINSLFEYVADKSLTLDENGSLRQMTEGYERMSKAKTAEMLRDLWADTPEFFQIIIVGSAAFSFADGAVRIQTVFLRLNACNPFFSIFFCQFFFRICRAEPCKQNLMCRAIRSVTIAVTARKFLRFAIGGLSSSIH